MIKEFRKFIQEMNIKEMVITLESKEYYDLQTEIVKDYKLDVGIEQPHIIINNCIIKVNKKLAIG